MSSLLERMLKNSTVKQAEILQTSKFFQDRGFSKTGVPAIDIALSGSLDGGLTCGVTVLAGPSRHFKTSFALVMAKGFMDKHPDSVLLFYDSEFGSPQSYFEAYGIDTSRVIHTPVTDLEQLKHDTMVQLKELSDTDKVIIVIDSIGNLASKKEVDDAIEGKSVADMTRAKQMKSLFRMITPHLTIKNIPLIAINHIYMTQEMYSKPVVSGGQGVMLAANTVWIIGRQQEKDGTDVVGYNFIINVEKSRFVKEKSKVPITVEFDAGISKWSGLLDIALESGHVEKPKVGWYTRPAIEGDKNYRANETNTDAFWSPILSDPTFKQFVEDKYKLDEPKIEALTEEEEDDGDEV